MRGREITLWLDERWYDALSKHLKGETLEEHLENVLDEMCNQLPQQEYERSATSSGRSSRRRRRLGRPHGASLSSMSRRTAAPIIFWPRKILSCSRPPAVCAATSASRPTKRPTALSKRCCAPSGSLRRSSTPMCRSGWTTPAGWWVPTTSTSTAEIWRPSTSWMAGSGSESGM